jgi:uncharacterized membrane protein
MRKDWETPLERWTSAGLIDLATAGRIRELEEARMPAQGLRWPVLVALAFGTILLAAGILLFVSAHWDQLSPAERMTLVVLMIAAFHTGGALAAGRFEGLSISLHAIGTIALGAGIALAGQIYHLSEHWPSAILLWAIGAAIAWTLLRQWPQAALAALLAPCWVASEWWLEQNIHNINERRLPIAVGLCALAFTYLSAPRGQQDSPVRRALEFLGAAALIPTAAWVAVPENEQIRDFAFSAPWLPMLIAIAVPLALAFALRKHAAVWNAGATVWVLLLATLSVAQFNPAIYLWCFVGSVGLAFWGIREQRAERVNLAFLGFAITVLVFYFSDVMAKLDRALSLILLGVLFLGGGWLLERTRRKIIARMRAEPA